MYKFIYLNIYNFGHYNNMNNSISSSSSSGSANDSGSVDGNELYHIYVYVYTHTSVLACCIMPYKLFNKL